MENTKIKFRPILFSTPMVQALLEGRKTMTRRTKGLEIINPRVTIFEQSTGWSKQGNWIGKKQIASNPDAFEVLNVIRCPYEVGDVFWVRETFAEWPKVMFQYKASTSVGSEIGKWKPSIFMPKEACRLFLKIKAIRVERLQAISTEDARSEGIMRDAVSEAKFKNYVTGVATYSEKNSFYSLWESINGKESVENNPYVFVYEFEQIEKPLEFN